MTTAPPRTTRANVRDKRSEHLNLGLTDEHRRPIGLRITRYTCDFVPVEPGHRGASTLPPGTYYAGAVWITRNGIEFGAFPGECAFPTAQELEEYIQRRIKSTTTRARAKHRATKKPAPALCEE